MLTDVRNRYGQRHRRIEDAFQRHFNSVKQHLPEDIETPLTDERCQLIGAFFTMEYSLESVALFNPSMVVHPNQAGVPEGSVRFVMSLRACGEGHISSIEFRSGIIDEDCQVSYDTVTGFAAQQRPIDNKRYDKRRFFLKLIEMGAYTPVADLVLDQLADPFTMADLRAALDGMRDTHGCTDIFADLSDNMLWLAHSNYQLSFPPDSSVCERVIFPVTENESRGIEDARFVRFTDDDGQVSYYATYTAYNGFRSLPQLIQTTDFVHFKINTLNGKCVQNKGMALFPRTIGGEYVMASRLDGENIFMLKSDNLHFWNRGEKIKVPVEPWEFVQVGNCGSPLETDQGWLLLTHGVGPMREYWMGAVLLDIDDPMRVIGYLKEPLLAPLESEREGYVPNVVYSCGGILHRGRIVIPYAVADTASAIATVSLDAVLDAMVRP